MAVALAVQAGGSTPGDWDHAFRPGACSPMPVYLKVEERWYVSVQVSPPGKDLPLHVQHDIAHDRGPQVRSVRYQLLHASRKVQEKRQDPPDSRGLNFPLPSRAPAHLMKAAEIPHFGVSSIISVQESRPTYPS
jgi:hypothetical protein